MRFVQEPPSDSRFFIHPKKIWNAINYNNEKEIQPINRSPHTHKFLWYRIIIVWLSEVYKPFNSFFFVCDIRSALAIHTRTIGWTQLSRKTVCAMHTPDFPVDNYYYKYQPHSPYIFNDTICVARQLIVVAVWFCKVLLLWMHLVYNGECIWLEASDCDSRRMCLCIESCILYVNTMCNVAWNPNTCAAEILSISTEREIFLN